MKYDVSVIGLGYIGLPTAALLANAGYKVCGVDVNTDVVANVKAGRIHFVEPNLESLVSSVVEKGGLEVSSELQPAKVFLVCVPTPMFFDGQKPVPNIDYVIDAAKSISLVVQDDDLIILESTSPIGTTETIENLILSRSKHASGLSFAYCPERVLPGSVLEELIANDRVVGGTNSSATARAAGFYRSFVEGEVFETTSRTAEMCKLAENSFRDVNIAFANELSMICEESEVNVGELVHLANRHPRVNILKPGVGVGGHCIAVDPWFLISSHPNTTTLIRNARQRNLDKTGWCIDKISEQLSTLQGALNRTPKVGCLGLSFKPNIDDMRESPALDIVSALIDLDVQVLCVEPNIQSHQRLEIVDLQRALDESDMIVGLVAHDEFADVTSLYRERNLPVLDLCGL